MTKAIARVGLSALARKCGVTYQAVRKWERLRVPAERCHAIQLATDGAVTIHDLRPDIFGPAPGVPPKVALPVRDPECVA
jgi:DNA-binding transcriptional regulator YdaS (Cro superfamily)